MAFLKNESVREIKIDTKNVQIDQLGKYVEGSGQVSNIENNSTSNVDTIDFTEIMPGEMSVKNESGKAEGGKDESPKDEYYRLRMELDDLEYKEDQLEIEINERKKSLEQFESEGDKNLCDTEQASIDNCNERLKEIEKEQRRIENELRNCEYKINDKESELDFLNSELNELINKRRIERENYIRETEEEIDRLKEEYNHCTSEEERDYLKSEIEFCEREKNEFKYAHKVKEYDERINKVLDQIEYTMADEEFN